MPELSVRVDGPEGAPVVVLSPSLGTTAALWDPQVPALATRFRVVRYDHPGHGSTPPARRRATIDDLGADVVALLDRLGVGQCDFAGVSLGGMVGLWLAAAAPERVRSLAVCCSSAYLPPATLWTDRAATVRARGTGAVAESIVSRWFTPAFQARQPDVVAATVTALEGVDDEGYAACCEVIAAMDLRPSLAAVKAPTLVIAGADDPATPPDAHARVIAEAVPDARLEVLPEAAHLANLEQPESVSRLLLEHFNGRAAT